MHAQLHTSIYHSIRGMKDEKSPSLNKFFNLLYKHTKTNKQTYKKQTTKQKQTLGHVPSYNEQTI